MQETGTAQVQSKGANENYFVVEPDNAGNETKNTGAGKMTDMAQKMINDRGFISKNTNPNLANDLVKMLKPGNYEPLFNKVMEVATEYGKNPAKPLSAEDSTVLLNFRVNLNAILKDQKLRDTLVDCASADSKLKDLIKNMNSAVVRAGFKLVTPQLKEDEKLTVWETLKVASKLM